MSNSKKEKVCLTQALEFILFHGEKKCVKQVETLSFLSRLFTCQLDALVSNGMFVHRLT